MQSPPPSFPCILTRIYSLKLLPFCLFWDKCIGISLKGIEFHRDTSKGEWGDRECWEQLEEVWEWRWFLLLFVGLGVVKEGGDDWSTPRIILFIQVEDKEFSLCVICLLDYLQMFLSIFTRKMTLIRRIVAWVSQKRIIKNIDNFSTSWPRSHLNLIYMLPLALFSLSRKISLT